MNVWVIITALNVEGDIRDIVLAAGIITSWGFLSCLSYVCITTQETYIFLFTNFIIIIWNSGDNFNCYTHI